MTIIVEVGRICKTMGEDAQPLGKAAFLTALPDKGRRVNGFEPFYKTAEKPAFWRDIGVMWTRWRDVGRDWRDQNQAFQH